MSDTPARLSLLPRSAGVSFKPQHFAAINEARQPLGFFEIHAENYMGAGGRPHAQLKHIRENYALSVHGVGLSIGAPQPLDKDHLARLKRLCDRYEPHNVSEHLAWSTHGTTFLNDLLPLPYTEETLSVVTSHIDEIQTVLKRQILLENPATYVRFAQSSIPEAEFIGEIARRTGCGLLLDVNNVFVSAINHGNGPTTDLSRFPLGYVHEIHLAGHSEIDDGWGRLLIDAHGSEVADPVMALYARVIAEAGPIATLIEWDNDVPEWRHLLSQASTAQAILDARASQNRPAAVAAA
jgi:uncharacterized protein (UPF0276 family)